MFLSHGVLVYVGIIITVLVAIFMNRTKTGLNLKAVGENPAAADAAANFAPSAFLFGMYFGVMIVDIGYSFKVVAKIREWAKTHNAVVRLEELRLSIRNRADKFKEKCSFILSFKTRHGLGKELDEMKNASSEKKEGNARA